MSDVSLITGAYPTVAPTHSSLLGKTSTPEAVDVDADVKVVVSAGTGTVVLCGWDGVDWCPVGSVSLDSTVRGGVGFGRFSPGTSFGSYLLWEETAGATVTRASITSGRLR